MIHDSKRHSNRSGFTLIELMLSMAFVSVLLLAIAMTIIQAGNIYSKGMALKDINQSARLISTDIRRTVAAAGNISLGSDNYIVRLSGGVPVSGRLCLGNYTYLWNTVDATPSMQEAVRIDEGGRQKLIGAIKVPDTTSIYCARNTDASLVISNTIRSEDVNRVTQLLVQGDHSLSLASFSAAASSSAYDSATGQRLFMITYAISTGEASAIAPGRETCRPPGENGADPIYCNIQKFNLVVRSGGGV